MGFPELPKDPGERGTLRQEWRCQRTACVFHEKHCPHGLFKLHPEKTGQGSTRGDFLLRVHNLSVGEIGVKRFDGTDYLEFPPPILG
jgi:hypothetical protein